MTDEERIAYIQSRLDQSELLCQLAEEASELAQAALKLRRALDGTNPTPKSRGQCSFDLREEVADVALCIRALGCFDVYDTDAIVGIEGFKAHRWAERLREKEGEKQCKKSN